MVRWPYVLLLLAGPAWAADVPEWKGMALGAPMAEVRARFPSLLCMDKPGDPLGDVYCTAWETRECKRGLPVLQARCKVHDEVTGRCTTDAAKLAELQRACAAERDLYAFGSARAEYIALGFFDGRLGTVYVTLRRYEFAQAAAALQAKFGPPAAVERVAKQNRAGAVFESREFTWRFPAATIVAEEYGAKVDEARVRYTLDSVREEVARRVKARAAAGADNL